MMTKDLETLNAQYPVIKRFLPDLQAFLKNKVNIFAGDYDYLVPVESKGAALFDWVYATMPQDLFTPPIRYPRSFDFLSSSELEGRRVAVIDDTVFSGRTLWRLKKRLEKRGVSVDTYTFAMDETPCASGDREEELREATPSALRLRDATVYNQYLMELRHWSSRQRILSLYDHLVFRVRETDEATLAGLFSYLNGFAELLDYGVRAGCHAWAALLPEPCPWLEDYQPIRAAVPPKIRLWHEEATRDLLIVPMWYPAATGPTSNPFTAVVSSSDGEDEARARDALDTLSLSARVRLIARLFTALPALRGAASLDRLHLERTFTPRVTRGIKDAVWQEIDARHSSFVERTWQEGPPEEAFSVPYLVLAMTIREELRRLYEEQIAPRAQRESRGLAIAELLVQHPGQRASVHAAVDFLLDFGYATTCFASSEAGPLRRVVRTTENNQPLLIEKLAAAYIVLTKDKRLSSTEAAKLVPLFKNVCHETVEGCNVKHAPGGKVGVIARGNVTEDVVDALQKSRLVKTISDPPGQSFTLNEEHYRRDEVFNDPEVNRLYGRLTGIVTVVHNTDGATPAVRATLISVITSNYCGLDEVCEDAEIIAGNYGSAYNLLVKAEVDGRHAPPVTKYLVPMGRARAEGAKKLQLLTNVETQRDAVRAKLLDTDPYAHQVLDEIKIPKRWSRLLQLWGWYLDQYYESCRAVLAWREGRVERKELDVALRVAWPVGPPPSEPFDRWLSDGGHWWRNALSGQGSGLTDAELRPVIAGEGCTFAHYDLADSKLQKKAREFWLGYAANTIHAWSRLFGCTSANSWEMQAESGFVWSHEPANVLAAAAWSTYALYVLSEIKGFRDDRVENSWDPIFCLCIDSAAEDAISTTMGLSAKVTKHLSRADAERVAGGARDFKDRPDLLENRAFLLGGDLIQQLSPIVNGQCQDLTSLAERLGIDMPLVTVPLCAYLDAFLSRLPSSEPLRRLAVQ